MHGLHISVTCAALFIVVALVAYHLGGGGNCREDFCTARSDCVDPTRPWVATECRKMCEAPDFKTKKAKLQEQCLSHPFNRDCEWKGPYDH